MTSTALVPLHSPNRFRIILSERGWVFFDTARCCFSFPEWVSPYSGFTSVSVVKAQAEQDFEEVLRIRQDLASWCEDLLRGFAAAHSIPYDLLIAPIPKEHEEEPCLK